MVNAYFIRTSPYLLKHVGNDTAGKWSTDCLTGKMTTQQLKGKEDTMTTYKIPKPIRVSSNCQKERVNEDANVIALHRMREIAIAILRLTLVEPASIPSGNATSVKTRVNAGPAKTSYSMPVVV